MKEESRIRIAIQKSGRLSEKSTALFQKCGLDFELHKNRLFNVSQDFPIDLMLVRDDDIPGYVADGICDLGIVGENIVREKAAEILVSSSRGFETLRRLGFGKCRLSLAAPDSFDYDRPESLEKKRIATSYPNCLKAFLKESQIQAQVVELGGSVEIAPALNVADLICDLVSTGTTLKSNGLKEIATIFKSEACLIRGPQSYTTIKSSLIERLLQRIDGVLLAGSSKYIMMNAPKSSLEQILKVIPGMEEPSVLPIGVDNKKVAIHAVASEEFFWETIERLKALGANSILVLPIEKVIL
jgi:ATP phosphoribosyltransferase